MLQTCRTSVRCAASSHRHLQHAWRSTSTYAGSFQEPNAPLELDPSLRNLLKDADMSLQRFKPHEGKGSNSSSMRELEVLEFDEAWNEQPLREDEAGPSERKERKSTRAAFGSKGIGSVFLPGQLQNAIGKVIDESDKPRLHEDAKRLFRGENGNDNMLWDTVYDAGYKSRKQATRHAERDGAALASVALPAHYSAVYAVLENVKHRLGKGFQLKHVIEWGSGVGSGLWASLHAFRAESEEKDSLNSSDILLSQSILASFLGIDKRRGLTQMAERLLEGKDVGGTNIKWSKGFADASHVPLSEGQALALSAFHLSSLPTAIARKALVKQIWNSGASVIVLIDHDSAIGFESIAGARDQLLRLGRKGSEDPVHKGKEDANCHVVAPCPHDGACPLFQQGSSKLRCTFTQRLQRPSFLRKTKHVRVGHEDIGYSYVVIRRGRRPVLESTGNAVAAQGEVAQSVPADDIRVEAYGWPRLVFPPLKRSGHVILDGCTSEGKIMRMTIPRSQGKQAYYDARKSSWGDIFPHKPKNAPQVRLSAGTDSGESAALRGADIRKRQLKAQQQKT